MTPLVLLRHGATDWNAAKRLQGRSDRRLSASGRKQFAGRGVPRAFRSFDWYSSPLARAIETAALLNIEAAVEPALVEMAWGDWEGRTLSEIETEYGAEYRRRTAMGLDLRPHGGESPRDVQARLADWLTAVAARGRPAGAVTHKGVMRAILSLATGWDMTDKPPYKLDWTALHLFALSADGGIAIEELNIGLERT